MGLSQVCPSDISLINRSSLLLPEKVMSAHRKRNQVLKTLRKLQIEQLEVRQAMNADSDDQISEAKILTRSASDRISPSTDVDMYKFQAAAGETIDFDIDTEQNGAGGLDSYLRLFNAAGQRLNQDSAGRQDWSDNAAAPGDDRLGVDSYLRYRFSAVGTYYIGVSNNANRTYNPSTGTGDVSGGTTGRYELLLRRLTADRDDQIAEAKDLGTLRTDLWKSESADIDSDLDVDMYKFTVRAEALRVYFDVDTARNGPGGLGGYMRIFNAQGSQLAFNNDAAAPGDIRVGFDPFLRFTFPSAGTYYVGISNVGNQNYDAITGGNDTPNWQHALGEYRLRVRALGEDRNDSIAVNEARIFSRAVDSRAQELNGEIAWDVDVEMFKITLRQTQSIDIDIDTPRNGPGVEDKNLDSYIRVFDSNGNPIPGAENDNAAAPGEPLGSDSFLRLRLAAGSYFVGVSNRGNIRYNAVTGGGDAESWQNTIGTFKINVRTSPGSQNLVAGGGTSNPNPPNNSNDFGVNSSARSVNGPVSMGINTTSVMSALAANASHSNAFADSSDVWFSRIGRPQVARTEDDSLLSDFNRIDFI